MDFFFSICKLTPSIVYSLLWYFVQGASWKGEYVHSLMWYVVERASWSYVVCCEKSQFVKQGVLMVACVLWT